jgi:hypothetical protein
MPAPRYDPLYPSAAQGPVQVQQREGGVFGGGGQFGEISIFESL